MTDISLDFLKTAVGHITRALTRHYTILQKRSIRVSLVFDNDNEEITITSRTLPTKQHQIRVCDFLSLTHQSQDFSQDLKYLLFCNIISFQNLQQTKFLQEETIILYEDNPIIQTAHEIMQTHAFMQRYIHIKTTSLMDFQSPTFEGQQP